MKAVTHISVYDIVTDAILEKLEKGVVPWRIPWAAVGMPKSLITRKEYSGVNVFTLSAMNFNSPFWLTVAQANKLGGWVRKGEKASPVVFFKFFQKTNCETDENGKPIFENIPVLRYYPVFNLRQCEGIFEPELAFPSEPKNPIEAAEEILGNTPNPPIILTGKGGASYSPATDSISMPSFESFYESEAYYAVLFHELVHATGHPHRLNRQSISKISSFGAESYSKEELVAELGASFLCGHAGIGAATLDSSASYIQSWLSQLKNDKRLIVFAAAQAQKAADYILGRRNANHP